jgi:hypothetical protein
MKLQSPKAADRSRKNTTSIRLCQLTLAVSGSRALYRTDIEEIDRMKCSVREQG